MRRSARNLLANHRLGALLALLASVIVSPTAARAGCSAHYLMSRSSSGLDSAHLELLSQAQAFPTSRDEAPRDRPAPCSGAMCSGNPATPLSTVPAVPPAGSGQWAIPGFPFELVGPESFACPPVDANPRPVDQACSVFHPPRRRARPIIVTL